VKLATKSSMSIEKDDPHNKRIYMVSFTKIERNHNNRNLEKEKASTHPFPKKRKALELKFKKIKSMNSKLNPRESWDFVYDCIGSRSGKTLL